MSTYMRIINKGEDDFRRIGCTNYFGIDFEIGIRLLKSIRLHLPPHFSGWLGTPVEGFFYIKKKGCEKGESLQYVRGVLDGNFCDRNRPHPWTSWLTIEFDIYLFNISEKSRRCFLIKLNRHVVRLFRIRCVRAAMSIGQSCYHSTTRNQCVCHHMMMEGQ